ncbi:MAG: transcriptional regulator NrdR [Kiritimatiellae bacterium]|nr:transcriptional regulator NrdR [Kiritimatiellia bacterium]MDD3543929.1 transcriptional regulator NrdR [Kiritimatiellia bacterium]MDD4024555.1 transcriptional regulator NrdR [Kiritimatiellia bacterium]MDD4622753.1 transcriptional regulator NrdR [Kiritimatiellia bacterium]
MRCPKCGHSDDKVLDSRSAREGASIRRRRQCLACEYRFTTYEEIVKDELRVIKRDNRREEFSRLKLERGLMRACEKRPVSADQIHDLVDQVIESFEGESEVTSDRIGQAVMTRLHRLDDVAYIRFASVYRRFADVNQFFQAVKDMVES